MRDFLLYTLGQLCRSELAREPNQNDNVGKACQGQEADRKGSKVRTLTA